MVVKMSCAKDGGNILKLDKDIVISISEEYEKKIRRFLDKIISFDVHVKCHSKEGNVKRFEVISRLNSPGYYFEASSDGYNIKDAAKKTMEKLLSEIKHKTKSRK
jgi:hypothetical protein